ncbi:MAG: response regulator, partial [Myxococcota bacterium]
TALLARRLAAFARASQRYDGERIVVVDDDGDMCETNASILRRQLPGSVVVGFTRPVDAIRAIEHDGASLLVTDLRMPKTDGLTLTKTLRADPKTSDLPVLVVTGAARHDDVRRLEDAGASAVVGKPVEPRSLGVVARSLVGSTRPRPN